MLDLQPVAADGHAVLSAQLCSGLKTLAPGADNGLSESLANILAATASGAVTPQAAEIRLAADQRLTGLLAGLAGQRVAADDIVVSFGSDNQFGDVHIGTVARTAISLNIRIVPPSDSRYDVRGLPNPFLGLRSFTYEERGYYAGRDAGIASGIELLTRPGQERGVTFILGVSGAGKSSFVQAGLTPALERRYAMWGHEVRRALMHPGASPRAAVAQACRQLGLAVGVEASFEQLLAALCDDSSAARPVRILLIDQMEEIFTHADPEQRRGFLDLLARLADFGITRTHTVATMRVDYLPDLFNYPELFALANDGITLREMGEAELRAAIRKPVLKAVPSGERQIEEALVERLARDTAPSASYLPLLQVTLEDLWARGWLQLSSYRSLADAIQHSAEDMIVWADPVRGLPRPTAEQGAIMALLLDLIEVGPEAGGRRDVLRRRNYRELVNDARQADLIRQLQDARLVTRSDDQVALVHEALITGWPRLRDELDRQRVRLRQRSRFEEALLAWRAAGCDDSYLLMGAYLVAARSLAASWDVSIRSAEARRFLEASLAADDARHAHELAQAQEVARAQARAASRLRWLVVMLVFVILQAPGYYTLRWALGRLTASDDADIARGAVIIGGEQVAVASFAIERYEVTNEQYRRCVQILACGKLAVEEYLLSDRAHLPVVNLNAFQAAAYCAWVGRRLPSATEWLLAVRGPEQRSFPWGDAPATADRLNIAFDTAGSDWLARTAARPVTDYPLGRTPDTAIYNLAGNALEWTATPSPPEAPAGLAERWDGSVADTPIELLYAGVGFHDPLHNLQVDRLTPSSPGEARGDLGMRCAMSR